MKNKILYLVLIYTFLNSTLNHVKASRCRWLMQREVNPVHFSKTDTIPHTLVKRSKAREIPGICGPTCIANVIAARPEANTSPIDALNSILHAFLDLYPSRRGSSSLFYSDRGINLYQLLHLTKHSLTHLFHLKVSVRFKGSLYWYQDITPQDLLQVNQPNVAIIARIIENDTSSRLRYNRKTPKRDLSKTFLATQSISENFSLDATGHLIVINAVEPDQNGQLKISYSDPLFPTEKQLIAYPLWLRDEGCLGDEGMNTFALDLGSSIEISPHGRNSNKLAFNVNTHNSMVLTHIILIRFL